MTFPLKIVGFLKSKVDNAFKFTINTSLGTGTTFTWPLPSGQTYDFWWTPGDGSPAKHVTSYNDADITYDYGVAFNGQISATGKIGGFSFNNGGDKLKVTSVSNWGDVDFDYFTGAFYGCVNLTSLPSGNLTGNMPNLNFAFKNTGITSIPTGIFDKLTAITGVFATFEGSNITSIPAELHRYNTLLQTAGVEFQLCPNLVTIGEDLYYYNSVITSYVQTFYQNINMQLPTRMFNTANLSIVTSFSNFMPASSTGNSSTGNIQDIWNYATSATSVNAFLNQTALTNYASIPNGWKGL